MLWDDVLDSVKSLAGFDATDAQVKRVIKSRYVEAVTRARFLMENVTIGTTTAGTKLYTIPATAEEVEKVEVAGKPYGKLDRDDLDSYRAGEARWVGSPQRGFAVQYTSTGDVQVDLEPAPDITGLAITGWAAMPPADPTYGGGLSPIIPERFQMRVCVEGPVATLLALVDEQLAAADRFEGRFEDAVEKLRRYTNARVGRGAIQAKVH